MSHPLEQTSPRSSAAPSGGEESFAFRMSEIGRRYADASGAPVIALHPTNIAIPRNSRVAILGHSGMGKSTLLNLLGLLDFPDSSRDGDILYGSEEGTISFASKGENGCRTLHEIGGADQLRRRHFGFVFQQSYLLNHLTVEDNIAIGLDLAGVPRDRRKARCDELLHRLNLAPLRRQRGRNLSGGERQRVAVMRALAHEPHVVFADEPTASLDPVNARLVMRELLDWQRGGTAEHPRTLLLVTHNCKLAFENCDWFVLVENHAVSTDSPILKSHVDGIGSAEALDRRLEGSASASATLTTTEESQAITAVDSPSGIPAPHALPGESLVKTAESGRTARECDVPSRAGLRLRYLLRLAWQDIVRRETAFVTATTVLILALMSLTGLVGYGLLEGKRRQLSRELDSPQARRLDFAFQEEGMVDDALLKKIADFRSHEGRPLIADANQQLHLWNPVSWSFVSHRASDRQSDSSNILTQSPVETATANPAFRFQGRGCRLRDPYLENVSYVPNRPFLGFHSLDAEQIVVTERLLERCGLPPDARRITVSFGAKDTHPLEIVGVAKTLPDRTEREFVIPANLPERYLRRDLNEEVQLTRVLLDGIPPHQAQDATRHLSAAELAKLAAVSIQDGSLQLELLDGKLAPKSFLRELADEARDCLTNAKIDTNKFVMRFPENPRSEVDEQFLYVSIYANSIDELESIAIGVHTHSGLRVLDAHYLGVLSGLGRTIRPLEWLLSVIVAAGTAIAAAATGVNLWQQIRLKRTESSLLRACGMSSRQLIVMYALQGVFLAVLAAAISVPTSFLAGRATAMQMADLETKSPAASPDFQADRFVRFVFGRLDEPRASELFRVQAAPPLVAIGLLIVACVGAAVIASYHSARIPPALGVR